MCMQTNLLINCTFCRNAKKELNDIRFDFAVGKDSAEGIANELVGAGLVDSRDTNVITSYLQKLIESRESTKVVTFPLVSFSIHTLSSFLVSTNKSSSLSQLIQLKFLYFF